MKRLSRVAICACLATVILCMFGSSSLTLVFAGNKQNNIAHIEYMCSRCGVQLMRGPEQGKPEPGRCTKNNYNRHMWTKNRVFYKPGMEPKCSYSHIEYVCRHCGVKITTGVSSGKPKPSRCQRRANNLPHSWVIGRRW